MHLSQADTIELGGQVFGWLCLVALGLGMYWIVWFLIKKYLLNPLIEKSFGNESIEKDQKGQDRTNDH